MPFERLVGLQVNDDDGYAEYRAAMTPILQRYGGGFRYDFKVSDVLKNEEGRPINRVFILQCPDKQAMEKFFADPEYQKARKQFFDKSVGAITLLAEYDR